MSAFWLDWLNLLLRWAHMIAGIGWIGTSFYFIALDLSLRRREQMKPGVTGTAWEVHGGGFYHVEKFQVAPPELPPDLIWFKWEAYLTWLTGFALLVVQFYFNASTWMIDPQVMDLLPWQAIAFSVFTLVLGWVGYDGLCRSPLGRRPVVLAALAFVMILAFAWLYTQLYSGRAALIHIGVLIGTLMAFNVFRIIIPNQKKAVASLLAGESPDPRYGQIGKQRSVHNTYLTLPVIVLMVSGHYPMLTGHPHAWLLVGVLIVGGALARHFLVRHEVGDPFVKIAWTLPLIGAALLAAVVMTWPEPRAAAATATASGSDTGDALDVEVLRITTVHCATCHASQPGHLGFGAPPKGVVLESLADLRRYGALVEQHAVNTTTMPLGNTTGMTPSERRVLGEWLATR